MKKLIWIFTIASVMMLAGCKKNAEPELPGYRYVNYSCELSDDWFTYYEVSASYTDITGKQIDLSMGKGKKLTYKDYLPTIDGHLAKDYTFTVKASVRKDVKVDDGVKANFTYETSAKIAEGTNEKSAKAMASDGEKRAAKGAQVAKYISEKPQVTIIDFHYTAK